MATNLPKVTKGESFTKNYEVSGVSLQDAKIEFNVKHQGKLVLSKFVGDGITITNKSLGLFRIDPFRVNLKQGAYHYEIFITLGEETKRYAYGVWIIGN